MIQLGDMMVSFDEWEKLDLRVGTIKSVEEHPDADRLYIISVDLNGTEANLVAGLREHYKKDELIGKKVIILINLDPRNIRGVESKGMILAASDGINPLTLLTVDRNVNNGSKIS